MNAKSALTDHRPESDIRNGTHQLLLRAAIDVFAEKGYSKATSREITERAGSNLASINYHFMGKDNLYAEVWQWAWDDCLRTYPLNDDLPKSAPARKRMCAAIRALLLRYIQHVGQPRSARILHWDLFDHPEGARAQRMQATCEQRDYLCDLVGEFLGEQAVAQDIRHGAALVVSACLTFGLNGGMTPLLLGQRDHTDCDIDRLARRVTQFCLGGLHGMQRNITRSESLQHKSSEHKS